MIRLLVLCAFSLGAPATPSPPQTRLAAGTGIATLTRNFNDL